MSHFTVLVIGSDHEALLAPYHEFECTGDNNEFVQDIDITEEALETYKRSTEVENFSTWAEGYFGYETVPYGESPDVDGTHKYGYVLSDADGKPAEVIKRTNPDAKWDWWQVGGRWSNFLKMKEGCSGSHGERSWMNKSEAYDDGYCDQALLGDIDLEGMRAEARKKADEEYTKASNAIAGRAWTPWESMDAGFDGRRAAYWEQPVVKELYEALGKFISADKLDSFLCTREEFIQRASDHAISTYAIILDGQWVARGEMGWWGMSNDEVSLQEWDRRFNEMLDQLPADTLVTLVDCHI